MLPGKPVCPVAPAEAGSCWALTLSPGSYVKQASEADAYMRDMLGRG